MFPTFPIPEQTRAPVTINSLSLLGLNKATQSDDSKSKFYHCFALALYLFGVSSNLNENERDY